MGLSKSSLADFLAPISGGTGLYDVRPPWVRSQVQWIGSGYFILRMVSEPQSRWFLAANVLNKSVLAHEKIFHRSVEEKINYVSLTKMNPWPIHLAHVGAYSEWNEKLESMVKNKETILDRGYFSLWFIPTQEFSIQMQLSQFIVLDGHHTRQAQLHGLSRSHVFGWIEPIDHPGLKMASSHRSGSLKGFVDSLLLDGFIKEVPALSADPEKKYLQFEVLQPEKQFVAEVVNAKKLKSGAYETVVDAITRMARGKAPLRSSSNLSELRVGLERLEWDTVLVMPELTKKLVVERASNKELFPQKSTYFSPKIPFGLLVEDLS